MASVAGDADEEARLLTFFGACPLCLSLIFVSLALA